MICWILKHIAGLLRCVANLCDPPFDFPRHETLEHVDEPVVMSPEPKRRMKALLALDDLTPAEAEELATLASQFEGAVIFLDDPFDATSITSITSIQHDIVESVSNNVKEHL